MDSTPQSSPSFPPEIIDLFIFNLAPKKYDKFPEYNEKRDLAACGLLSRVFYLPSWRYLFSSITAHVDIFPDGKIRLPTGKLREILVANPVLQDQIYHLVVAYPVPYSYAGSPFDQCEIQTRSDQVNDNDGLSHIVRLVPALRKLTICSTESDWREPAYFHAGMGVDIHLTFDLRGGISETLTNDEILGRIEGCASRLLSLLSTSTTIDLRFFVKVHTWDADLSWDIHAGISVVSTSEEES